MHQSHVVALKQRFLQEYKEKFPERYSHNIDWAERKFSQWFKYYLLSILFFLFAIGVLVNHFRNKARAKLPSSRFIILILFSAMLIIISRYQAEQYIETRLFYETIFVTNELKFDTSKHKLSDNEISQVNLNLFAELKKTRPSDWFWLSRYLEYIPFVERTYPKVTDEQFEQQYGYTVQSTPTPNP